MVWKFDFDLWIEAFEETGINGDFYALRERDMEEVLPWDFINIGVSKKIFNKRIWNSKDRKINQGL